MATSISPEVLTQIRQSIITRTGLAPQDWVLTARVQDRMLATNIGQSERYLKCLEGRAELIALVELLRVGETRFFRHDSHMRTMATLVLPHLRRGTGSLDVWSAGCATGEEAYTLAMLLSRELAGLRDTKILASDISPETLRVAETGIYRDAALSKMPATYRKEMTRLDDSRYQVPLRVQDLVRFEEHNLAHSPYPGTFDLIFCRNVLIYFEEQAKQAALGKLVRALKPGAFLFLGYSESLRDVEGLQEVREDGCVAYRRLATEFSDITLGKHKNTSKHTPRKALHELCLLGEYRDGRRLSDELDGALAKQCSTLVVNLDGADYLPPAAANVLREARGKAQSMGIALELQATRDGHQRFLRRHELS